MNTIPERITDATSHDLMSSTSLKINEIFYSIQGEGPNSGLATIFIRLSGCPLRCQYCDTAYAFYQGDRMSIQDIFNRILAFDCPYVLLTGGEPLAQKNSLILLSLLCDKGYQVALETSGAIDASEVDHRVRRILDIKTPGSGEDQKNLWSNVISLRKSDIVKYVICNHSDYLWACKIIQDYALPSEQVYFSPSHEELSASKLAEWILKDQRKERLQIQLHKSLWGNEPGR